jgi:hypothetical protein
MKNGAWDYLEYITSESNNKIDRNDNKTWKNYWELYPKYSMLMQQFGIGQAQYVWDIRQNKNIIEIFAKIWNVKKMN